MGCSWVSSAPACLDGAITRKAAFDLNRTPLAIHQVSDALEHMPSLLVLDDLDLLCPAPSADPGAPPAPPHADALVQWLTDVLDALRPADGLPYPG